MCTLIFDLWYLKSLLIDELGELRVDLRSVGERHCEVVQRQVWVRIHQQERHQGRCVRPPGNAILITHRTTVLDGNSHKLAQSIMHCFRLPSSRTTQRRLLGPLATARLVKSLYLQCTFCVRERLQLCIAWDIMLAFAMGIIIRLEMWEERMTYLWAKIMNLVVAF